MNESEDNFMMMMLSEYEEISSEESIELNYDYDNNVEYRSREGYTTNDSMTLIVKSVGKTSFINTNQNYRKIQYEITYKEINDALSRADFIIGQHIIKAAANLYHYGVQQNQIKRGNGKLGCHAACFHRMCKEYGISQKYKEIVKIFGINRDEISNGNKTINNLISRGLIPEEYIHPNSEIFDNYELYCFKERGIYHKTKFINIYMNGCIYAESLIKRYFNQFEIPIGAPPTNLFQFANILFYFTTKFHISESSIPSSKCAGIIYIIGMKYPEYNIKNRIGEICDISKGTYMRFVNNIIDIFTSKSTDSLKIRSMLRRLFKDYKIPI